MVKTGLFKPIIALQQSIIALAGPRLTAHKLISILYQQYLDSIRNSFLNSKALLS